MMGANIGKSSGLSLQVRNGKSADPKEYSYDRCNEHQLADTELPVGRLPADIAFFGMPNVNTKSNRYTPQGDLQQEPVAR